MPQAGQISVEGHSSEDWRCRVGNLDKTENDQRDGRQPQQKSAAFRLSRAAENEQRADHCASRQIDGNAAAEAKPALHAHFKQGRDGKADEERAKKAWPEWLIRR